MEPTMTEAEALGFAMTSKSNGAFFDADAGKMPLILVST